MKPLMFITHDGRKLELDSKEDVKNRYCDLLNWQIGENGEIAFVKVGKYKFGGSKFKLIFTKWQKYFGTLNHQGLVVLTFNFFCF
jgi:vomeronasal 2 receptor